MVMLPGEDDGRQDPRIAAEDFFNNAHSVEGD
jgi:hypothetical protein